MAVEPEKLSSLAMRNVMFFATSIACALLLGVALYLRLNEGSVLARLGILVASLAMALLMIRFAGRAAGGEQ